MKGKPTWKPVGLRAKRWREPGQSRVPAGLLPAQKLPRQKAPRKGRAPAWQPENQ